MVQRPILRAYVDETGDRGTSPKSSPFFAFACVLVPNEDEPALRSAVARLRVDLQVPAGRALHWQDHAKTFPRRQHVAAVLAATPVVLVYVLVEKAAIPASAAMRADHVIFYNFAAALVVERVLLAARHWAGGARDAVIRFGHVRGFDHTSTTDYFARRRRRDQWVPWHLLRGSVHFDGNGNWDGLQAADQYAGMLSAALRPDQFGSFEPYHLLAVRHQVRRVNGTCWGYGFKVLGTATAVRALPWWPVEGL